jgi:hypothetical protein
MALEVGDDRAVEGDGFRDRGEDHDSTFPSTGFELRSILPAPAKRGFWRSCVHTLEADESSCALRRRQHGEAGPRASDRPGAADEVKADGRLAHLRVPWVTNARGSSRSSSRSITTSPRRGPPPD